MDVSCHTSKHNNFFINYYFLIYSKYYNSHTKAIDEKNKRTKAGANKFGPKGTRNNTTPQQV
jgi:hypothetical protein